MFRLVTVALFTLGARALFAGVTLDGSFGTHGALPGPNFIIPASVGKQIGGNLFQSFSQFNLISSESATFTGLNNVQNILSRVTSGSPSSIDGKVSSQIQGANLFFLNPAGVMFGQHAQLDVSGSVAVTTANYVKLVGGGRFNANLGGQDVLTSAPVSAFGFLNPAPAPVFIVDSTLNVAPEKSFSVVAGGIGLGAATVSGQSSRVNLISVQSTGEAELDPADLNSAVDVGQFTAMGEIDLIGSAHIDTSGPVGGPVVLRAGTLFLDNSQIASGTTGTIQGRPMDIAVFGDLKLVNRASISTNTSASGTGGNLSIHAGSLLIRGTTTPKEFTGISAGTKLGATGNAGDLIITVDRALSIERHGQIGANTFSSGNGGNMNIHAGTLLIDGSAAALPGDFTGIGAESNHVATGNAGDITVNVGGALRIVGSGLISAVTASSGNGGNVSIHAGSLSIKGSATPNLFTEITAESLSTATGDAGSVNVTVDRALSIVGHGEIGTSTSSSGNGGNVVIHAGSLLIDGSATPFRFTGIAAESDSGATGSAGDLTITVDQALRVVGSGLISAVTASSAKGGKVSIHAGSLSIDGAATPGRNTGITAESLQGATGLAGSIDITSAGTIKLSNHGSIKASSNVNGGNITIKAPTLVYLIDSEITAEAGDTGGNITVDPTFIVLNNSRISANAAAGRGGNINLISDFFFNSSSVITATGTTNGTINITAPALDLGAELITLPGSLVSAANQLQERCTALLQGDFSSFISIGRGGTEPEPDELESGF